MGDDEFVVATIESRAGHAFDPVVANAFVENWSEVLGDPEPGESVWDEVLSLEPKPWLHLEAGEIDRALAAVGSFADLASPYLAGHSYAVGDLAAAAAELCGWEQVEIEAARRAGYLHDLGRVAVHPRVWENDGRLSAERHEPTAVGQ